MSGPSVARSSMLNRGEACSECRRRKVRCDGGKPSCIPCIRAGKADQCEYSPTLQDLEDQLRVLQERILALEQANASHAPTFAATLNSQTSDNPVGVDGSVALQVPASREGAYEYAVLSFQEFGTESVHSTSNAPDIPITAREQYIATFAQKAHNLGLPPSSISQLSHHAALSEVACAYETAETGGHREYVLRAEAALARSALQPSPLDVQAMALLASLAFARNHTLEGYRHLGAATYVARALKLNEVDQPTWALVIRAEQANRLDAVVPHPVSQYPPSHFRHEFPRE